MFAQYIAANQAKALVASALFQLGAGADSVAFVYDAGLRCSILNPFMYSLEVTCPNPFSMQQKFPNLIRLIMMPVLMLRLCAFHAVVSRAEVFGGSVVYVTLLMILLLMLRLIFVLTLPMSP